jgi:hypothetical protein
MRRLGKRNRLWLIGTILVLLSCVDVEKNLRNFNACPPSLIHSQFILLPGSPRLVFLDSDLSSKLPSLP